MALAYSNGPNIRAIAVMPWGPLRMRRTTY